MFDSLKYIIERRLGTLIVLDDLAMNNGYFLKIAPKHLPAAAFFLKNDPDTRLTLLDQIVIIPAGTIAWPKNPSVTVAYEILYQLKSLKLPYSISLVVEAPPPYEALPSISLLFLGAKWPEADIRKNYNIEFENFEREVF
jgi:NADH:ubiquinone oxidoreductase subunit C